jgi:hypothetical protein
MQHETLFFSPIIDHRVDPAIAITDNDAWIICHYGNRTCQCTTKGWELCVTWKDHSTSWIPLKDLKISNPLQVAEYALAHDIAGEPALAWWINDRLKHQDCIISAVGHCYIKKTHKFGIELPRLLKGSWKLIEKLALPSGMMLFKKK